jgi:hypothetical protein
MGGPAHLDHPGKVLGESRKITIALPFAHAPQGITTARDTLEAQPECYGSGEFQGVVR